MIRPASGGIIYDPPRRCIYCGALGKLTREHIVPFGLHGELVLPGASCPDCQRITSGLETFVLKNMLGLIRTKYGFRSQNNNNRRRHAEAYLIRHEEDGSETKIPLSKQEMPFHTWAFPVFNTPALAWQAPYETVVADDTIRCIVGKDDAEMAVALGGGKRPVSLPPGQYHAEKFMRFLAKVAHSYACAELGVDSFEHASTGFILNGHERPRVWVGGELEIEPAESDIYMLQMGTLTSWDGQIWLSVRMRFLSWLGTPTYVVVIGKSRDDEFTLPEDAAYRKTVKISVVGRDGIPIFTSGV